MTAPLRAPREVGVSFVSGAILTGWKIRERLLERALARG